MPAMLVLDTNAMSERGMLHFLRDYHAPKLLPAVAAAEYSTHLKVRRRWDATRFLEALREARIEIEPLDAHLALAAADMAGAAFGPTSTGALIGTHALAPGRMLVTNDLRHHPHVPRKVTPAQLLAG